MSNPREPFSNRSGTPLGDGPADSPDSSPRRESLTAAQREQLAQRLRGNQRPRGIVSADRSQPVPLSFLQEQLWLHQELHPESIAYNRPLSIRIQGPLNLAALERSLSEIVRRHETLRTVIHFEGDQPFQAVLPIGELSLPLTDLASDAEPFVSANRIIEAEARRSIDIRGEALWRARLLRCATTEHILVATFHHMIFDAWSESILLRELPACYEAFSSGRSPELPELPVHYADYSVWQRAQESTAAFQKGVQFWIETLRNLPVLPLPTDRPRQEFPGETGDSVSVQLSPMLVDGLKQTGQRDGVTLFMMLLAAWYTLLYRYSGQTDLVVGCPVAGRSRQEFEGLIGVFINTLPLRLRLSGEATFRQLLKDCRQTCLHATQHQDVTLQQIVRQAVAPQGKGGSTGFDVMFIYEHFPETRRAQTGTTFETAAVSLDVALADLTLELNESGHGIHGKLVYRTELWDRSSIERLVGHFQKLLEAIVADPETPADRLPLLADAERRQLLVDWNHSHGGFSCEQCVHEHLEVQVERTPDAVAIVFGEESLTYRELNTRANRLAHHLRQSGARPDSVIAVCVERSPEMIVALLAILKSGAAYLPLDTAYPPQRLSQLLTDAEVSLVVTEQSFLDPLPLDNFPIVCLDRDEAQWASASSENPAPTAGPDQLAYVIYTSGSTGKPKGVEILHRGAMNFLQAMQAYPGLTTGVSILAITTITFDISVLEIFLPLIGGGCVELVSREVAVDGFRLRKAIENSPVTVVQATPTTWRMLLEAGWQGSSSLTLITGGESLTNDLAHSLLSRAGRVWNMYGPTETTVWATVQQIDSRSDRMTVGRPVANMQAYILDRHLQPTPIGIPGELFIGGEGVARGYRGRIDLTAERFLPDPFRNQPSARLYKTGDLARFLSDGTIEHLGRLDQQIKMRGHRIEPGEIESLLCEHKEVAAAAVVLWGARIEEHQLAAYVMADPSRVTGQELRDDLKGRLPAHMVPATITFLEQFPLTSSGKIDRKALPAPARGILVPEGPPSAAPQSPLESSLTAIWSDVLGAAHVGRDDNFFELGGHSLLALRVAARMSAAMNQTVPVALFFQYPTVAAMAAALTGSRSAAADGVIVELKPGGTDQAPLFLFPPLGAEMLTYRILVQQLPTDRAVFALDWHAGRNGREFNSLDEIARYCAEQIRKFRPTGPYILAGYSFGGRLAFETACRLIDASENVALVAIIDAGPGIVQGFSRSERLLGAVRFLVNLPRWICYDFLADSAANLAGRLRRKVKQIFRRLIDQWSPEGKPVRQKQIEDLFDAHQFPPWFQQRQQADLLAATRHQPVPYPLKVTLFRARVRPLLHGHLTDLAWRRVASLGVEVHHIPGHHGTILRPPFVIDLASKLAAAMNDSTQGIQGR